MKTYLKIKICSLAAEAKIIKREERRWFKHISSKAISDPNKMGEPIRIKHFYKKDHPLRMALRAHRIDDVRTECRSAHIAYGYLRGRCYKQIENKCYVAPNWERIAELIRKYGGSQYVNVEARKKLAEDLKLWSMGSISRHKAAA